MGGTKTVLFSTKDINRHSKDGQRIKKCYYIWHIIACVIGIIMLAIAFQPWVLEADSTVRWVLGFIGFFLVVYSATFLSSFSQALNALDHQRLEFDEQSGRMDLVLSTQRIYICGVRDFVSFKIGEGAHIDLTNNLDYLSASYRDAKGELASKDLFFVKRNHTDVQKWISDSKLKDRLNDYMREMAALLARSQVEIDIAGSKGKAAGTPGFIVG